jgi:hypothetical protein
MLLCGEFKVMGIFRLRNVDIVGLFLLFINS